jgi:hypothetical protein
VEAKYTSTPPQLAVWRALRSGHFLLATVCAMSISMNILAVALSGLFDESLRDTIIPMDSNATYIPLFNGTPQLGRQAKSNAYKDHFYATLANLRENAPLPPWVDKSFFYLPFDIPNSKSASDEELHIEEYSALTRGFGVDLDCEQIFEEGGNDTLVYHPRNNGSDIDFGMVHKLADGGNVTCVSNISLPVGELTTEPWEDHASASEFVTPLMLYNETGNSLPDNGYCNSAIVSGWVRIGPANSTDRTNGRSLQTAFMRCLPTLRTAVFNVTVDTTSRIINSTRQSEFDTDLKPYGTEATITSLITQTSTLIMPLIGRTVRWHNDTIAIDWINSLLKIKFDSDLLNSAKPVPDIPTTIPHFTDIYQRLVAVMFSFDTELFEKAPANSAITVLAHAKQTRIFMTPTMFYISIIILVLQLLTLVAYYTMRPRRFLPRMPLSIASVIAYVSASQAAQDYGNQSSWRSPETRYGYGRFKGADGRTHVGIEKEPLVIPLKSKNPEATRRKWRFGRSLPPEEPRIWI